MVFLVKTTFLPGITLAKRPFALLLRNEVRLLEQIEKRVGTADEIRMVGVDQRGFDFNQIQDHLIRRVEAVVQNALHHVVHARLKLVVSRKLRKLDL